MSLLILLVTVACCFDPCDDNVTIRLTTVFNNDAVIRVCFTHYIELVYRVDRTLDRRF